MKVLENQSSSLFIREYRELCKYQRTPRSIRGSVRRLKANKAKVVPHPRFLYYRIRYLDERDGDRELEKYNGKPCSIIKKFDSKEYGELCTVRFADDFETDVLACDVAF